MEPMEILLGELQRYAATGTAQVSLQELNEALCIPEEQLLEILKAWEVPGLIRLNTEAGKVSVDVSRLASGGGRIEQTVSGHAYTQAGNFNAQNVFTGTSFHLSGEQAVSGADTLRRLIPEPGREARQVLRNEGAAFIAWLKGGYLPTSAHTLDTWAREVEAAVRPLAQALAVATMQVPEKIVASELQGLLTEALQAADIRLSLTERRGTAGGKIYPFALLAYTVAIMAVYSSRLALLRALGHPSVDTHGQEKRMGWLYLLHYLNQIKLPPLAADSSFTSEVVPTQNRILDVLTGEVGWLREDLPLHGAHEQALLGENVLALLILDADLDYASPVSDRRTVYRGVYSWYGEELRPTLLNLINDEGPWKGSFRLSAYAVLAKFLDLADGRFESWNSR